MLLSTLQFLPEWMRWCILLRAFGSRKTNPYSRMFAREAFKLLFPALFRVLDEPADMEIRAIYSSAVIMPEAALMNSSAGPVRSDVLSFRCKF